MQEDGGYTNEAFFLERGIYCTDPLGNFKANANTIGDIGTSNTLYNTDNGQYKFSNKSCIDRAFKNVEKQYDERRKQSMNEKHQRIGKTILLKKLRIKQDANCVEKSDVPKVPDGNWGWVIVFSSFLIQFIIIGPLASCLCNKFSERAVIMISGAILAASMIFTGLAPNIYFAFFTFGILGGIGRSLAYCPAIVMVGVYFKRKQGLATGIAASGCGIGGFALTLLTAYLFNQHGFLGAFLLLGGISLQIVALGLLMRPLDVHRRIEEGTRTRNNNTNMNSSLDNRIYTLPTPISIGTPDERCKDCQDNMDCNTKSKILEFSVLKDSRFLGFCITMMLSSLAEQSAFVFLPAFAEEIGILGQQSSGYTVAITSVCSTFAKIITGFIFDHSLIRPHRVYLYNFLMSGLVIVTFIIPSVTTFLQLAIICALYGLFAGSYMAQKSVIIVDILGRDKLKHSYGILMMFQGMGSLVGPPLSGLFKDINGRYDVAFYIGGAGMFIGTSILFINNVLHAIRKRDAEKKQDI